MASMKKITSLQWFVVLSNVTTKEWKMLISLSFIHVMQNRKLINTMWYFSQME